MKSPILRALSIALACGVFAQTAQARVFYVAPGGRDDTEATKDAPLGRPERAVRFAGAGDTVVLRGGTYNLQSSVYIDKPGLTLINYPGEHPILRAPNDAKSEVPHVVVVLAPRVTVAGLELRGGSYYGLKIDVDEAKNPARGVTVRGCRIGDTGRDCIKTFDADQLTIENCDIGPSGLLDNTNAEGIDSIGSHGVTIRNCRVHDMATTGIYFKGGATDGLIEGCTIRNSRRAAGILFGQDTDPEFMRDGTPFEARRCIARRNVIVHTAGPGVGTYSGENIRFENNTLVDVARENGAGLWVGIDRRRVPARGVSFGRNIVVQSGARPFVYLLEMQGAAGGGQQPVFFPRQTRLFSHREKQKRANSAARRVARRDAERWHFAHRQSAFGREFSAPRGQSGARKNRAKHHRRAIGDRRQKKDLRLIWDYPMGLSKGGCPVDIC